jgi:hypothetical protein
MLIPIKDDPIKIDIFLERQKKKLQIFTNSAITLLYLHFPVMDVILKLEKSALI